MCPIFQCHKCGCVENTALSGYWFKEDKPALCSECDPEFKNKWHEKFPRIPAKGYFLGNDGFLYHKEELEGLKWREEHQGFKIVKEIT